MNPDDLAREARELCDSNKGITLALLAIYEQLKENNGLASRMASGYGPNSHSIYYDPYRGNHGGYTGGHGY